MKMRPIDVSLQCLSSFFVPFCAFRGQRFLEIQNERSNAMSLKFSSLKLVAGVAMVAGLAVMTTRSGTAQEAADVLINAPVPVPGVPRIERFNFVNKLSADGATLTLDGRQTKFVTLHDAPNDKVHEIRDAARALNEAEGDEAKGDAKAKLTELLDKYFEADLERREQELAEVEERVNKLRSTLERRREKKRDILDLQMEVLLNEADGLGFFGGDAFFAPRAPFGLMMPGTAEAPPAIPPVQPRAVVAPAQPKPPARGYGRGGGGYGRGGYEGGYGSGYGRGGYGGGGDDADSPAEMDERRGRERERERERERDEGSDTDPVRN
jgi:hypothetical protein